MEQRERAMVSQKNTQGKWRQKERERKKGREYKAWNTETNIKRESEF